VFTGMLQPAAFGECVITAALGRRTSETRAVLQTDLRTPREDEQRFAAALAARGGVSVTDGGTEDALLQHLRELMPPHDEPRTTYPMRSSLWLVPFVACLCAEWVLRRRLGLR
jgi:hypothetical protein